MKKIIPVTAPSITQKEIDYVSQAATLAWKNNANMFHDAFEKAMCLYLNIHHALPTSSCTGALHLAYKTLDIKEGDEVIMPDITWTATAAAATYVGAIPVFADIDPISWCVTAESIEKKITSKTKAIVIVNLYGNIPDFNSIKTLADKYNLPIIEDAAESIGSEYETKKSGTLGDIGVFSFHGTKTLTTGEGGMLVTNNTQFFERALFLSDHGRAKTDRSFWNTEIGYKYKMSSMQAALGLAQLERIDELVDKKRQIFSWYKEELKYTPAIQLNSEAVNVKNSYWMSTLVINKKLGIEKTQLQQELKAHGIDTRPFFYPLSLMPAYKKYSFSHNYSLENPISYNVHNRGINLPSGHDTTHEDVIYIATHVKNILNTLSHQPLQAHFVQTQQ